MTVTSSPIGLRSPGRATRVKPFLNEMERYVPFYKAYQNPHVASECCNQLCLCRDFRLLV